MREAIERVIAELEETVSLCDIVLEMDEDDKETRAEKEAYESVRDKLKAVIADDQVRSETNNSR